MSVGKVRNAQAARNAGVPGYYVRNAATGIVVAGPFGEQATAQREASKRNREVPLAPDRLEVVLVGEDRVSAL